MDQPFKTEPRLALFRSWLFRGWCWLVALALSFILLATRCARLLVPVASGRVLSMAFALAQSILAAAHARVEFVHARIARGSKDQHGATRQGKARKKDLPFHIRIFSEFMQASI